MPFGTINASITFSRYTSDLFQDLSFDCVYLDDKLIFAKEVEEHWLHSNEVLR